MLNVNLRAILHVTQFYGDREYACMAIFMGTKTFGFKNEYRSIMLFMDTKECLYGRHRLAIFFSPIMHC